MTEQKSNEERYNWKAGDIEIVEEPEEAEEVNNAVQ